MAKRLLLALVEHRNNEIRDVSWEIMAAADHISSSFDLEMAGVLCDNNSSEFASRAARYCPLLYCLESEQLHNFTCDRYCVALEGLIEKVRPAILLLPHTIQGMELGACLGGRLGVPFLPDCLDLVHDNGSWIGVRELFGGKVRGRLASAVSDIVIASIRPGKFDPASEGKEPGEIKAEKITLDAKEFLTEVLGLFAPETGGVDITKSEVIVGVGRGVGDKEKVGLLESLAESIGGSLAATRPVVDMGWLPRERQVGQSGKTVKPKVYIACGVSGASQHIIGMKRAHTIVAINTDSKAPIFNIAHLGVVGDIFDVLPPMIEAIRAKK